MRLQTHALRAYTYVHLDKQAAADESIPYLKNSYSLENLSRLRKTLPSSMFRCSPQLFILYFMCIQTHLRSSVLLYLYLHPRRRCKNIFFTLSLIHCWFMSAFEFLFTTSQASLKKRTQTKFNSPPKSKLTWAREREAENQLAGHYPCHFSLRFDERDRVYSGKSITLMNFVSFFAQMLTPNNNNVRLWAFYLLSIYDFFSFFFFTLIFLLYCTIGLFDARRSFTFLIHYFQHYWRLTIA